ncbi:hypothetical protein O4J56_04930 [Nocardiopsis sp. RSe5-2]|uniref:DUF6745 domain-containing protein n=1 Tax=Nocardiopsis endophytica TaxID=3018445 RepID=A0ABT4TZ40_9ACTN|nr:hypothetical protein [Nocardiopsis endophytica]MDA2809973.1 hypothetical protein [Nocardiopsis endophytica]
MPSDRITDDDRRTIEALAEAWKERASAPDRADVEEGFARLYREQGMEPPKIVWFDSPMAGMVAAYALAFGGEVLERTPLPSSEPAPPHPLAGVARAARLFPGDTPQEVIAAAYTAAEGLVPAPVWAGYWVMKQAEVQTRHPSDPDHAERVRGTALTALTDALLPADRRGEARSALARIPDDEQRWWTVTGSVRHPADPASLLAALLLGAHGDRPLEDHPLLRIAPGLGPWWAFDGVLLATDPPVEVHTDARGRLHRADGPAVRFADGFSVHLWHAHRMPPGAIAPGWTAGEIAFASDEEVRRRAEAELGPGTVRHDEGDVRRCAAERLGWARLVRELGLEPVAGPTADPEDPASTLALYDLPEPLFGRPSRLVVRSGGPRDGVSLLVPTDADEPVAAAAWLTGPREEEWMPDDVFALDMEMEDDIEHVEEVHLIGGQELEPFASEGAGGTYYLCGEGPRRPVLFADSEGGCRVLGRDLKEALELLAAETLDSYRDDLDTDGLDPDDAAEIAADIETVEELIGELKLTPPSTPEEYEARVSSARAMSTALTLIMTEEGNAYEYRDDTD